MVALASNMAPHISAGTCLLFEGDLGSGKTTFARALIQSLCGLSTRVPSPTFTLLQTYETPTYPLWHLDLYRIQAPHELIEIGFPPDNQTVCLVEWPERLGALIPADAFRVSWSAASETSRTLTFDCPETSHPLTIWLSQRAVDERS